MEDLHKAKMARLTDSKEDLKGAIFKATGIVPSARFINHIHAYGCHTLNDVLHLPLKESTKIPNFGAVCQEVLRQIQRKMSDTGQSLYFSKESEGKIPEAFNDFTHAHAQPLITQLAQLCKRLTMIFRLEYHPEQDTWSIHLLNHGETLVYATKDTSLSYAFEMIFDYIGYQFMPVQLVLPSSR